MVKTSGHVILVWRTTEVILLLVAVAKEARYVLSLRERWRKVDVPRVWREMKEAAYVLSLGERWNEPHVLSLGDRWKEPGMPELLFPIPCNYKSIKALDLGLCVAPW